MARPSPPSTPMALPSPASLQLRRADPPGADRCGGPAAGAQHPPHLCPHAAGGAAGCRAGLRAGVGCDLQLPVQLARRSGQRSGWQARTFVGGWKVVGKGRDERAELEHPPRRWWPARGNRGGHRRDRSRSGDPAGGAPQRGARPPAGGPGRPRRRPRFAGGSDQGTAVLAWPGNGFGPGEGDGGGQGEEEGGAELLNLVAVRFPQKQAQIAPFEALLALPPAWRAELSLLIGDFNCGIPLFDSQTRTFPCQSQSLG